MKTPFILICCALFFLFSCSKDDNPVTPGSNDNPPPPDTANTMRSAVLSVDTMPDTLYYGDALTFQVCFSDSDGDAAAATVTGLPAGVAHVAVGGDTAYVTLNIFADSLAFDSLYTIRISGTGSDAVDTLVLTYPLLVLDSNRVGGIRKLAVGMWWRETAYDTLVSVFDSTGGFTRIIRDTLIHQKTSRVINLLNLGGAIYYVISSVDTMNGGDSVYGNTMLLRHTDSLVEMILSLNVTFLDSLRVRVLELPCVLGNAWQTISADVDTPLQFGTIPVRLHALLDGSSIIQDTVRYSFGGAFQKCHDVATSFNLSGYVTAEATIRRGTDTLARAGDTVITSWSRNAAHQYFSVGLTVPLRSFGTEVKYDTNEIDMSVKRDTIRSSGHVSEYYDPRTGDTLSLP